MPKPSNLIVLDGPSNDLDIETLELLEALLGDYKGTVILISHDRQLLENDVDFYTDKAAADITKKKAVELQTKLDGLYERWELLEERQ